MKWLFVVNLWMTWNLTLSTFYWLSVFQEINAEQITLARADIFALDHIIRRAIITPRWLRRVGIWEVIWLSLIYKPKIKCEITYISRRPASHTFFFVASNADCSLSVWRHSLGNAIRPGFRGQRIHGQRVWTQNSSAFFTCNFLLPVRLTIKISEVTSLPF